MAPRAKQGIERAVFLDRDGTLIEDRGHLADPSQVALYPGAVEALRRLQEKFLLFIVTNQSGVARGLLRTEDVERVNSHLLERLAAGGVRLAGVYVCPHQRSDNCRCIKPKPYFLERAAADFGLDLARCFSVGDHPHDVELARNVGGRGIYVSTGHGMKHLGELTGEAVIVADVVEAAGWILRAVDSSVRSAGKPVS